MLKIPLVLGHTGAQDINAVHGSPIPALHLTAQGGLHDAVVGGDIDGGTAAVGLVSRDEVGESGLIKALLDEIGKGIQNHPTENICPLGVRLADGKRQHGLTAISVHPHTEILADVGGQHRAGKGLLGILGQIAGEQGEGERLLGLVRLGHVGEHDAGIGRKLLGLGKLVVRLAVGRDHGSLQGCGHGRLVDRVALVGQHAVDIGELGVKAHVARQVDDGVCRVVVALIGLHELLVGEVGDRGGISARNGGVIADVGEKLSVVLLPHDVFGLVFSALHLVEHHARDGHTALTVRLKVPRLLLENAAVGEEQGVEDGVKIHRHEVHEVLLVGGDEIVEGLVRVRDGVQSRRHGGLDQVDEGLLQGKMLRAVKAGMLQNMENARVVLGQSAESHRKEHLTVMTVGIVQSRARGLVPQLPVVRGKAGDVTLAQDAEAVNQGVYIKVDHRVSPLCKNVGYTWFYYSTVLRIMQEERGKNVSKSAKMKRRGHVTLIPHSSKRFPARSRHGSGRQGARGPAWSIFRFFQSP